jgi:hypothetical protein
MTELSPGTRNILTEGVRALAPSQAARDRIRAGLAARLATPGGDHGSGSAGATGSAAGAILKGSLITIAAIGLVGGAVWLARRDGGPEPAARAPTAPAPAEPAVAVAPQPAARTPAPVVKPLAEARDRRPARRKADRRDPAPRRGEKAASELAREVELIDRARRALAGGDADAARALVARHRREIAAPQMEREALLVQAEAQCAAARADDGLRTLARVEARWPGAAGVAAVRAMCREAPR